MVSVEPIAIGFEEACELTHTGRDSFLKLMEDPRFPYMRIGKKYIFPVAGLRKYFNDLALQHYGC